MVWLIPRRGDSIGLWCVLPSLRLARRANCRCLRAPTRAVRRRPLQLVTVVRRALGAAPDERGTPTSAHPFKFLDYFDGVDKPVAFKDEGTLEEALGMLQVSERRNRPTPRFSITELHRMAHRFVKHFPISSFAACGSGRPFG